MRSSTLLSALALLSPVLVSAQGLDINTTRTVECDRKTHKGDKIKVDYKGTLQKDGTKFDSSYDRKKPFEFTLGVGQVIKGWDQGLVGMCIGEARTLTIPPAYGYGYEDNGPIPAGSTLIFETELLGIQGVEAPPPRPTIARPDEPAKSSTTIVNKPASTSTSKPSTTTDPATASSATITSEPDKSTASPMDKEENGECHLLGPYALFVQAALGLLALSSLAVKRWRETPRRPLKIWFFDVSKQVFGSALLHLANVFMSLLSSGTFDVASTAPSADHEGNQPNPCSFYLLNIFIDTTIGIPILILLLRMLHKAFLLTPVARPVESIRSGNYGQPPRVTWWLKQSLIYFLGLFGMKLCVFLLFALLPWIAWVGDWALRWTEGNEAVQIAFVMFIFPLIMNALQYWIIDGFIKDPATETSQYVVAAGDDSDDDVDAEGDDEWLERHRRSRRDLGDDDDNSDVEAAQAAPLKEANPTMVPIRSNSGGNGKGREYDPAHDGAQGSGGR